MRVRLLLRVRSAHCKAANGSALRSIHGYFKNAYLEELAITAVEDELNGDVRAILESGDVRRGEVDWEAESAFTGDLEEGYRASEVLEARRDLQRRQLDSD